MDPLVFLLVAAAAVLHVGWNVLLKTAGDPLRAAAVGMGTAALVICPLALVIWLATGRPDVPAWTIALSVVSGALEAIYFAFLAAAYRRGDLSLVYPLARGTAPLLAVAIGVLLLNERLGPIGFLGVGALLAGLLSLQRPWQYIRASGRASGGAAAFALLTGITIAAYSAVDRVAVRGTTPWIYAGLIWASGALLLWGYAWIYRRRRATEATGSAAETPATSTFSRQRAAVGGVITLAAYLLILGALSVAPLTAVTPLRESAVVLASGWGAFGLREAGDRREAYRRIGSAGLVLVGALLLAID